MPIADPKQIERHDGTRENDPRVYVIDGKNYRSTTSVLSYDPEGTHYLMEWAKKNGEDADIIRDEAGLIGSVFHEAAEKLVVGEKVTNAELLQELKLGLADMSAKYDARKLSHSTTLFKKLQWKLQGLVNWWIEFNPTVIASERVVYSLLDEVAGALDLHCTIGDVETIVDFKTSKSLHQSHEVQVVDYGYMLWGEVLVKKDGKKATVELVPEWWKGKQLGLLHVGNTTKQGYTWKVVPDKHRNGKCVPGFRDRFLTILDLHRRDYIKVAPRERVLFPETWSL